MDVIHICCPYCSEVTDLQQNCQNCSADLRQLISLRDMAFSHYNQSLECISREEWDFAWNEIQYSLKLFPYAKNTIQFAFRLARDLGYYQDALQLLVLQKQWLTDDEFTMIRAKLDNEIRCYNLLLHDPNASMGKTEPLLVHRMLLELHKHPSIPKTKVLVDNTPLRVAAILVLLLLSVNIVQVFRSNSQSRKISELTWSQQQHGTKGEQPKNVDKNEIKPSKGEGLAGIILSNPDLFKSLSAGEKNEVVRKLYKQRSFQFLKTLDFDSWYVKSAEFLCIWDEYRQSKDNPQLTKEAIAKIELWTIQNANFPSHYGDACLELLKHYSSSSYQDYQKQVQVAQRLSDWVGRMPQTMEYKQYLNRRVRSIVND